MIIQWIDLLWLPLAWLIVHKNQRIWVTGFLIANMVMMRLLIELMDSIHYSRGITGLWSMPVQTRGLMIYSFFYLVYLLLAYWSPRSHSAVFMAASITIFFAAATIFSFAMLV